MNKPILNSPAAETRRVLRERILRANAAGFEALALDVFRYQVVHNPVYRRYVGYLSIRPEQVTDLHRVPFMPISFFRHHAVRTQAEVHPLETPLVFASSGTTGSETSRHHVPDEALYDAVSQRIFEETYGPLVNFHILALLPSYLERNNSSLVYMVRRFIEKAASPVSGFFLNNTDDLTATLRRMAEASDGRKILLIGVTFGLLDWAESGTDFAFLRNLPNLIVMETGGMKGRRRELLREEVHAILTGRLGVPQIHSEYGMTELLSQAYSSGEGIFRPSATLRVLLRDVNDPFHLLRPESTTRLTGGINVVDLANLDSCSFIETQDLGQFIPDQPDAFRVIGRFDNSDIRGCNLMIE